MIKIPLSQFVEKFGQYAAAEKLGVTQPAVAKALKCEREIYVFEKEDGTFFANEIKPFPSTTQKGMRAVNQE